MNGGQQQQITGGAGLNQTLNLQQPGTIQNDAAETDNLQQSTGGLLSVGGLRITEVSGTSVNLDQTSLSNTAQTTAQNDSISLIPVMSGAIFALMVIVSAVIIAVRSSRQTPEPKTK